MRAIDSPPFRGMDMLSIRRWNFARPMIPAVLIAAVSALAPCQGAAIDYTTSSFSSIRGSIPTFYSPSSGSVTGADVVGFEGTTGSYGGAYDPSSAPASL